MVFFQGRKAQSAVCLRIFFAGLLLFMFLTPHLVFANACSDASQELRGSFEVTQGRGGIWGYMEKISSLRGDSVTGFQVDGKLSRIIVFFETQCTKTPKPSRATFEKIDRIIGDARMIFNMRPGRNPIKEIKAKIEGLNASLDKLIKELGA